MKKHYNKETLLQLYQMCGGKNMIVKPVGEPKNLSVYFRDQFDVKE